MQILEYLAQPDVPNLQRHIAAVLKESEAFDKDSSKTIEDVAGLLEKDKNYIGRELLNLTLLGFLAKHSDEESPKVKRYYLKGKTSTKTSTKTTTKSGSVGKVLDLFNEELVKVFGEKRKIKILSKKRETEFNKLINSPLKDDLRTLFKGFFHQRKEKGLQDYLDITYVNREPERYLALGEKVAEDAFKETLSTEEKQKLYLEKVGKKRETDPTLQYLRSLQVE